MDELAKKLEPLRIKYAKKPEKIKIRELEEIFGELRSPNDYLAALALMIEQGACNGERTDPIIIGLDKIYETFQNRAICNRTYTEPTWTRIEEERSKLIDLLDRKLKILQTNSFMEYTSEDLDDEYYEPTDEELQDIEKN